MTLIEQIITIGIAVIMTMFTRFLPFFIFSNSKNTPAFINRIGTFLPPAILGMLVVYSYKDTLLTITNETIIGIVSGVIVAIIHFWKRNMFLSIISGTLFYMILINVLH